MKAVLSDSNGSSPKAYGFGGQDRRKKRERAFRPFSARGDIKMERIKLWDSVPGSDESVSPEQTPELLYFPCEGAKSCVAVFPGGGYAALCDDYEGTELAEWFTTVGVAAFVLRYRVLPYHYPCQIADAHRAIRYIRHNADRFGIDKDKIGAMGFSAGGHLVAATATVAHDPLEDPNDPIDAESAKLNAQILCYAVSTFSEFTHRGTTENFLGDGGEELKRAFSPELNVTKDYTPPAFIWHTFADQLVDVRNALAYAEACKAADVPFELHVFPEGVHGLGTAKSQPCSAGQWLGLLKNWLTLIGFREG